MTIFFQICSGFSPGYCRLNLLYNWIALVTLAMPGRPGLRCGGAGTGESGPHGLSALDQIETSSDAVVADGRIA